MKNIGFDGFDGFLVCHVACDASGIRVIRFIRCYKIN